MDWLFSQNNTLALLKSVWDWGETCSATEKESQTSTLKKIHPLFHPYKHTLPSSCCWQEYTQFVNLQMLKYLWPAINIKIAHTRVHKGSHWLDERPEQLPRKQRVWIAQTAVDSAGTLRTKTHRINLCIRETSLILEHNPLPLLSYERAKSFPLASNIFSLPFNTSVCDL